MNRRRIQKIKTAGLAIAAPAVFLFASSFAAFSTTPAFARSQIDLAWTARDVFHVAVRFIRVDRGCRVTDKDLDSGYITFECEGETPKAPRKGALELIPVDVQGRNGVRVQLSLADEPRYVELRFLELLERKLRDERGPSLPPLAKAPAPPPPDAGH